MFAKQLIADQNLPEWLIKYPSMFPSAKKDYDPQSIVDTLNDEDARLLSEYLGLKPYKGNGFTAQILVSMPDPETGEIIEYSVSRINPTKDTVNARLVSDPAGGITKLPQNEIIINKSLKPSWINYTDPLTKKALGSFDAVRCLNNSVFVTIVATIITLLINSMAAFALSKYRFNGQIVFFVIILATLMVPASVLIVGIFKMVTMTGLSGSLWGGYYSWGSNPYWGLHVAAIHANDS